MSDSVDRPRKMGLENSPAAWRLLVTSMDSLALVVGRKPDWQGAIGEEESEMADP